MDPDAQIIELNKKIFDLKTQIQELKTRVRQQENEIQTLENDRSLRIALFGAPGSGKSTLLAAWYLCRADAKHGISIIPEEDSLVFMRNIADELRNTGATQTTPLADPDIIRFQINVDNESYDVETRDFAGELLLPTMRRESKKLAEPSRAFVKTCDIVLCLFHWQDSSMDTIDALDTCLRDCESTVVLGLTKYDETGTQLDSAADIRQGFPELVSGNRTLSNLCAKLRTDFNQSGRLEIIPISALGFDFTKLPKESYPIKPNMLKPLNIYRPLLIAIKRKKAKIVDLQMKRAGIAMKLVEARESLAQLQQKKEEIKEQQLLEKKGQLAEARERLEELKRLIESGMENPEAALPGSYDDDIAEAERIEELAEQLEDNQLARDAKNFPHWLAEIRQRKDARTRMVKVEASFHELERQLTECMDGSPLEWFTAPVNRWRAELEKIKKDAEQSGPEGLAWRCQQLINKIRFRQLCNCLLVVGLIVLIPIIVVILIVVYVLFLRG